MDSYKQNISFFKFYFGIGSSFSKLFLFSIGILILIFSLTHFLEEVIIGVCIDYIEANEIKKLKNLCLILIVMGVLNGLQEILLGFLFRKHGENFTYTYKKNYYSLVLNQDYNWFVKKDLNELSESIKNDIANIEGASGKKLYYIGMSILSIPSTLLIFFLLSWKISLAILPLILLIFLITYFYQMNLIKLTDENISFSSRLSSYLSDFYSKFRTIKFFGNYNQEKNLFNKIIQKNFDLNTRFGWLFYFFVNSIFIVIYTTIGLVILIAGQLIITNHFHLKDKKSEGTLVNFDIGQIITIIISVFYLIVVSKEFLLLTKNISYGKESAQNYYDLLEETERKISQKPKNQLETSEFRIMDIAEPLEELKFIGVYLNYFIIGDETSSSTRELENSISCSTVSDVIKHENQEKQSLIEYNRKEEKNININVEPLDKEYSDKENFKNNYALKNINSVFFKNKINYLVGKTGSGKTSMISIITKLFKPTKGEVFLNDKNIYHIDDDYYLSLIGYVPQESLFYNISIRENIRFFRDDITDQEIENVCNFLNMEFLKNYRDGLDSKVGHNGSELSGGQKQLISLARALVKRPKILLLDEFTSNMDNILTLEVTKILGELSKEMIVIVVTHKIKLINLKEKNNNLILLNSGELVNKYILNNEINSLEQYFSNESDENIFQKYNSGTLQLDSNNSQDESTYDSNKILLKNKNSCFTKKEERNSYNQELAIFELEESHEINKTLYELIWIDNKKEICFLMIFYVLSSILNASNGLLIYKVNKSFSSKTEADILYIAKLISGIYLIYGIVFALFQTLIM